MTPIVDTRPVPPPAAGPDQGPARAGIHAALPTEYLSFTLGDEAYGIDILRVQEIRSFERPTRIANAPHAILGVVNLRGVIVPIVDLRLKLGFAQAVYDGTTVVIVLNLHNRMVGAVVDAVSDVVALDPASIKPPPGLAAQVQAAYLLGIGCVRQGDAERMLILADIDRMVDDRAVPPMSAPSPWSA